MKIIDIACPQCGASLHFGNETKITCEYCNREVVFQQEVETMQNDHQAEIDALTDRIYDLISQSKFIQAEKLANEGLTQIPYSGRLHLCLLLCELNLNEPSKLGTC